LTCVLDASAALSLVLADEFTPESQRILDYVADHGAIVPSLWHYEVANGLLSALRRGRTSERAIAQALKGLGRLRIVDAVDEGSGIDLIALAESLQLSAYDAAYVRLALSREAPLATRDSRLASAAASAGVALVNSAT
jgi:predicted nucleic acid-binding protein